jgi:hypothetical protein
LRKNETEEPGCGVRSTRIWTRLLGVEKTVIELVEAEEPDSDEGGPQEPRNAPLLGWTPRPKTKSSSTSMSC